jgi:hypothetical protein
MMDTGSTLSREATLIVREAFRRRAETRNAKITTSHGSGKYTVTYIDTGGAVTAWSAQPSDTYAVGKIVLVRSDRSGRRHGGELLILGYSQSSDNGVALRDLSTETEKTAETVTELPAMPVSLVVSGPSVVVTIYGVGLSTTPTYGSADIDDDASPVVNADHIILTVKANGSCAPGRYSLTVAGVTIPNFFEVSA